MEGGAEEGISTGRMFSGITRLRIVPDIGQKEPTQNSNAQNMKNTSGRTPRATAAPVSAAAAAQPSANPP